MILETNKNKIKMTVKFLDYFFNLPRNYIIWLTTTEYGKGYIRKNTITNINTINNTIKVRFDSDTLHILGNKIVIK